MPQQTMMESYSLSKEALERVKRTLIVYSDVQRDLDALKEENTSLVFDILMGAISAFQASDIHIDATPKGARIRMRVDGVLRDVAIINERMKTLVLSRVKILSGLKINVKNAQDGRFSLKEPGIDIEIRVSTIPSEFGEDIALRILDPRSLISLKDLGMRKDLEAALIARLKKPLGLILVTGPTGAGKTTTLYAALKFLNNPEVKIVTIEDPVEYRLGGISQTQIDEYEGYGFNEGIKAMLRQDPDIVMISELRDIESTTAALSASLAGRLVLSTLHANSAFASIPRLLDVGVKRESIASGLSMVVAQRLLRRLCQNCKVQKQITGRELNALSGELASAPDNVIKGIREQVFFEQNKDGCEFCKKTGFKGRIGVFELFSIDSEISKYISQEITEAEMIKILKKRGTTTMRQDAAIKILSGVTSFAETERVLGPFENYRENALE